MKKSKQKKINKILFLICIFIGVILLIAFISLFVKVVVTLPTKTYHSKFLKITFDYPSKFQLVERFGMITLRDKDGEILIDNTGTNYSNLDDFLKAGFERDNLKKQVDKQHLNLNKIDFVKTVIKYPTRPDLDRKAYYFYKDYSVYVISTPNVSLYPDLDQIIQAFRYEP